METAPKTSVPDEPAPAPRVEFAGEVLPQIRQHARSSMQAEICGVLIGAVTAGLTRVTARIAGEGASQGGAHVTFTQDTWAHIYKVKDAQFPDAAIVGWYHSHPGFGIFLSDYDLFIHENFFTAPHQIAWVVDPHSDEEGCFGWIGKKVEPLREVTVIREHRPPAPEQTEEEAASRHGGTPPGAPGAAPDEEGGGESQRWGDLVLAIATALAAFVAGVLAAPYVGVWQIVPADRPPGPSVQFAPAPAPAVAPPPSAPTPLREIVVNPQPAAPVPAPPLPSPAPQAEAPVPKDPAKPIDPPTPAPAPGA